MTVSRRARSRSRAGLHPRHRHRRPRGRQGERGRHPFSARAERLPPHRPRQVDLPQFRRGAGVRRPLQPPFRRHQPDQGGAGIHRRHRARRALARLRLGRQGRPRFGLFRAALRLGGDPHPRRQGLCRRPEPGGDAGEPRHADRAGHGKPVAESERRGESGSVRADARRRVPQWRPRRPGEDRHGVGQHQPARPGALSHPPRLASPDRHGLVHLSELRFRPWPVGCDRGRHAFTLHARIRRPQAALRLADR